ncbi:MAG TPA: group 1 truncated hemoglobin [Gammaproteobacteria bacterium]|nr:group 1 truncated hemoglobin [Gammaproteobacteria bacterium]
MSLYEEIGGEAAVDAAVDVFYGKILADKRISHYFENIDMNRQRAKQKAILTVAFGGPNHYTGKNLRAAHQHLHLTEDDFNAVAENLVSALEELSVKEAHINDILKIVGSVKADVLNQ